MDVEGTYYCSKCMRVLDAQGVCPFCGYDPASALGNPAMLEEGTLLGGRYLLGAVIGSGGFGITYAAWDDVLRVAIALKEYYPQDYVNRDVRISDGLVARKEHEAAFYVGLRRFIRESQVLAMLRNVQGIVKVFDCFEENNTAYITMEYVRGTPIDQYVKEKHLKPKEILRLMRQPIEALAAVHKQGIMHRDITPGNMLAQEDGTVKLIDFGSALELNRKSGTIIFTQKYAPIEQYDTSRRQGPWSDVYGMCATLYELLTGEAPLESLRREHRDALTPIARTAVRLRQHEQKAITRGLAVLPEKRIQSMEEFRSMLYNLPMPEEVRRRKRFVRRVSVAAAILVAFTAMAALNFTCGFPLGGGLLYSLYPDGFHVSGFHGPADTLAIPESRLWIPVTQIRESAFEKEALTAVELPGSLREIGKLAFHQCEKLETVTAEEGLRSIGDYAFADCPLLHSVCLPASVETIGSHAFSGGWERLAIWGEHGTYAENYASENGITFAGNGDYRYKLAGGIAVLEAYLGEQTQLTIPSYMGGRPVTIIANRFADIAILKSGKNGVLAEYNRMLFNEILPEADENSETAIPKTVTAVVLPEYLRVLNSGALNDHGKLTSVTLGSGLKALGEKALENTGIEELILPEGLISIGNNALEGVPIEEITFPDSLRSIGNRAFYGSALRRVDFNDGLQSIGSDAFYHTNLQTLVLPESVTSVGDGAFYKCNQLETVVWPAAAAEIPLGVFEYCASLTELTIPEGVTEIGWAAFFDCTMLELLVLPETMEKIDIKAFNSCTRLRAVYIPENVTEIDDEAFDGCRRSMLIVGHAGSYAEEYAARFGFRFENCDTGSIGMTAYGQALVLPTVARGNFVTTVEREDVKNLSFINFKMPTMLKTIGESCFENRIDICKVFMENVETIGYQAFKNCYNLEAVSFPDGLRRIEGAAFWDCKNLKEAVLPDSVEYIGTYAFYGCESLETIHIPANMYAIGACVFENTGLTEVVIPGHIANCERDCFGDCKKLKSVVAEEGVVKIRGSFTSCTALETVVLPSTLHFISWNPFNDCTALKDVWIYAMDTEFSEEDGFYWESPFVQIHLFMDCPDVTIHGYAGSDAETYAHENGLRFEPIAAE